MQGATFLTPYKRDGNLISPTLLDHVTPSMRIAWEEPFGPVMPIVRVKSVDEAVAHCNKNSVALQGCVFTQVWGCGGVDEAVALCNKNSHPHPQGMD